MAGFRIDRLTSDIRLAMSAILREVKDPRVSKMLSIIKVDVSGDLSYATFYVSAIEGEQATKDSIKALKGALGYIRGELGARVKMRKVPEVRFVADDSLAKSAKISAIIETFSKGGEPLEDEEN